VTLPFALPFSLEACYKPPFQKYLFCVLVEGTSLFLKIQTRKNEHAGLDKFFLHNHYVIPPLPHYTSAKFTMLHQIWHKNVHSFSCCFTSLFLNLPGWKKFVLNKFVRFSFTNLCYEVLTMNLKMDYKKLLLSVLINIHVFWWINC
jgi:hypothetical protein